MATMGKMMQASLAFLAAIVLTTTAVGAAVGPAEAAIAAPAGLVATGISGQAYI